MAKATKTSNKKDNTKVQQADVIRAAIVALVLGLGVGGGITYALTSEDDDSSSHSSHMEDSGHSHGDKLFEVSAEEAPKLELVVTEDKKSGYNIKLITTDFTFTPEKIDQETTVGEGHAHLYIGDEKVRVYSNYYHYKGSFEGTKTFRATLNANDHADYAVDGQVIEAEVSVTHDSSDPNHDAMHSDDDSHTHSDGSSHSHSDDMKHSDDMMMHSDM